MIEIKNRDGQVIYTSEEPSIKQALIKAVAAKANLGGADLRGAYLGGADLRGADLRGADLRGAYLRGAYLRGAYLGGADLRGAYLGGADLRGAYLRGADLRGAYLGGADLGGADLIDAGQDLRGYRFVAYLDKESTIRITAGCRDFSLAEARAHLATRHDPALQAEIHAKLALIEAVAAARGWIKQEAMEVAA